MEQESSLQHISELKMKEMELKQSNLNKALIRYRSETSRRFSTLKKEYDSKTVFLLSQVREMEERLKLAENRSTSAKVSNSTAAAGNGDGERRPHTVDGLSQPPQQLQQRAPLESDLSSHQINKDNKNKSNFNEASHRHDEDGRGSNSTSATTTDVIERKWQIEKQRREQLEKRNGELMRELRILRREKEEKLEKQRLAI